MRALSCACRVIEPATDQPIHGTALVIDGRGVLITGDAGTGKSSLALTLIRRARSAGFDAGLIADDRVILTVGHDQLCMACPAPLKGKVEVRGYGIVDTSAILAPPTRLALQVSLVPEGEAERYQMDAACTLAGVSIATLRLPAGPAPTAIPAVFAALGLPAWI